MFRNVYHSNSRAWLGSTDSIGVPWETSKRCALIELLIHLRWNEHGGSANAR